MRFAKPYVECCRVYWRSKGKWVFMARAKYIANTSCILLGRGKMVRFYTFKLMNTQMRDSLKVLSIVYERLSGNVSSPFHIERDRP